MGRICDISSFCYSALSAAPQHLWNPNLDKRLISRIHNATGKLVVACAGGGGSAIAWLLSIPGASRTVIEAIVPYHAGALADYIGGAPDQACSGKTARALAMAAFQRARRFEPAHHPLLGVGCTAALATDRARRGDDRCHVAVQSIDETVEYTLELSHDGRDRARQEAVCSELVIRCIARALAVGDKMPTLLADESLSSIDATAKPGWQALFSGETKCTGPDRDEPSVVFPGAFNPIHAGHRKMAGIAAQVMGKPVLLEISAFNVDKPPLDYVEMHARADGLEGEFDFVFSNAPTFVEKSALFPGATFVVGSDTLERIAAPRYYHDSLELRDQAIASIASRGATFMVFGRAANGTFRGLDEIEIPAALREISMGIPEHRFREDISSSSLRRAD